MSWAVNSREFANVVGLTPAKRYEYFVKRVADWAQVWSLRDDEGWALAGDNEGTEVVPVWPHEKFAEACATKAWSGYKPAPIKLRDWIDNWTPGMADDGRLVAVFPNLENNGAVVEPGRLKDDILGELDQIE